MRERSEELPQVSTGAVAWALRKAGFETRLFTPDSLAILRDGVDVGYVPVHDALHPGTLRAVLRTIGLSVDEFMQHLAELTR